MNKIEIRILQLSYPPSQREMSSKKKRKKKFQFEYIQKEIITTINNDLPLPLIKSISRIPENHPSRGGKHVLT